MLLEQKITLLAFESEFIKLLHLIKNTGNSFTLKKEKRKIINIDEIWGVVSTQSCPFTIV